MVIGQDAVAAAAVSAKDCVAPGNVNIKKVQDELRRQGVEIVMVTVLNDSELNKVMIKHKRR